MRRRVVRLPLFSMFGTPMAYPPAAAQVPGGSPKPARSGPVPAAFGAALPEATSGLLPQFQEQQATDPADGAMHYSAAKKAVLGLLGTCATAWEKMQPAGKPIPFGDVAAAWHACYGDDG